MLGKLGAGQLLLDVVGREDVRIGQAHHFLRAGRDERPDVGRAIRERPSVDPLAVATPQLQRERIAVARDFPGNVLVGKVEELPEIACERP